MNYKDRKQLVSEIEEVLDDLDYDLDYELDDYHLENVSIVEIDIDVSSAENYPEDWDIALQDLVNNIIWEWDSEGWTSWDEWILCISIPD